MAYTITHSVVSGAAANPDYDVDGPAWDANHTISGSLAASEITFTPTGTGAVARTVDSKLKDIVSVKDFGAIGDGITDDAAAVQAAINYAGTSGTIQFPVGTFKIASAITYSFPAAAATLRIVGAGRNETILYFSNNSGIGLIYNHAFNSVCFSDFAITAGLSNNTGSAFTLFLNLINSNPANSATNDFERITCRGSDGYASTNYWQTCFTINQVSNVNWNSVEMFGSSSKQGAGINLIAASNNYGVVYNVNFGTANHLENCLVIGSYIQGISVTGSNFTSNQNGIAQAAGVTGVAELAVTNSQFGNDSDINLQSGVLGFTASSNFFIAPSNKISLTIKGDANGSNFAIIGNHFEGASLTATTGIYIDTTLTGHGTIVGNNFWNLAAGIVLGASSVGVVVSSNGIGQTTTAITDSGTGNRITDNAGYNPVGVTAAATMGTSPFTVTAGSSPETHYVRQSATNTATITKGGQGIATVTSATAPIVIQLGPNESYITTWVTTAPTYVKDVH